jgi:hypothetical protein
MYQYLKDLAPRKRAVSLNSLPPALDITDDVLVGDIVIDTDSTNVWTCIDNSNGVAVYIKFGEVVHANTTSRDAVNSHPATAVSYSNVDLTATEVGGALDEVNTKANGKVTAPASNTANYIPQWNGANSKLLKDGLAVGTASNNLVQLDSTAKLPAVDGSQLTNLPAAGLDLYTIWAYNA